MKRNENFGNYQNQHKGKVSNKRQVLPPFTIQICYAQEVIKIIDDFPSYKQQIWKKIKNWIFSIVLIMILITDYNLPTLYDTFASGTFRYFWIEKATFLELNYWSNMTSYGSGVQCLLDWNFIKAKFLN